MPLDPKEIASAFSESTLSLILFPTEQCNFRCTYCYEDFTLGRMSFETIQGIKNLVRSRNRGGLGRLDVSWFGGEPLAANDIVVDLMQDFQAHASNDTRISSHITTNASLLDEKTFQRLLSLGVNSYQITLDGPKGIHDTTRLRANGSGTFDQIWKNLHAMKGVDATFTCSIRIHVRQSSANALPSFLRDIEENFTKNDNRFEFSLIPVEKWGGPNDEQIDAIAHRDHMSALRKIYEDAEMSFPEEHYKITDSICYASKPNSFIVRANGAIQKCTLGLYDSKNDIGHITLSGDLELNENAALWMGGWKNMDAKFLACPYSQIR